MPFQNVISRLIIGIHSLVNLWDIIFGKCWIAKQNTGFCRIDKKCHFQFVELRQYTVAISNWSLMLLSFCLFWQQEGYCQAKILKEAPVWWYP